MNWNLQEKGRVAMKYIWPASILGKASRILIVLLLILRFTSAFDALKNWVDRSSRKEEVVASSDDRPNENKHEEEPAPPEQEANKREDDKPDASLSASQDPAPKTGTGYVTMPNDNGGYDTFYHDVVVETPQGTFTITPR